MKDKNSGKKAYLKQKLQETGVYPDQAYDPMKSFSKKMDDENDKDKAKTTYREDDVVDNEYSFPENKNSYKKIKKILSKKQNN